MPLRHCPADFQHAGQKLRLYRMKKYLNFFDSLGKKSKKPFVFFSNPGIFACIFRSNKLDICYVLAENL